MTAKLGANQSDIHVRNRALVLQIVATEREISRVDLARRTGLTKTTASKIVSELIAEDILCETEVAAPESGPGRKPIFLGISSGSPCVCGLLIKRNLCTAILADYSGRVLTREDYAYTHSIDADALVQILFNLYEKVCAAVSRPVLAIGIAAIGPLDAAARRLGAPPNFFGISNLPLGDIFAEKTGLPVWLISDASAGALAEKVYGGARARENFIYLHIMNGIGAGYVLHNQAYGGDSGQGGEIGHTSINYAGPVCDCGNPGCLEMYANIDAINRKVKRMQQALGLSSTLDPCEPRYGWRQIITAAAKGDICALAALDEFCMYISHALANAVNLLDIGHIIVGYDSEQGEDILVDLLAKNLAPRVLTGDARQMTVERSAFGGDAPLIGAVAQVTNRLFAGRLPIGGAEACLAAQEAGPAIEA
ncbi:ROK family protein [Ruminococcaceae bacterium OttesenSCG-928-D13]|nr:ROK family protein [Ruminococcaceae bacterium OttesenSCG-928-D13]